MQHEREVFDSIVDGHFHSFYYFLGGQLHQLAVEVKDPYYLLSFT